MGGRRACRAARRAAADRARILCPRRAWTAEPARPGLRSAHRKHYRLFVSRTVGRVSLVQSPVRRSAVRRSLCGRRSRYDRDGLVSRGIASSDVHPHRGSIGSTRYHRGYGLELRTHPGRIRCRAHGGWKSSRIDTHDLDFDLRRRAGIQLRTGRTNGPPPARVLVRRAGHDIPSAAALRTSMADRLIASFLRQHAPTVSIRADLELDAGDNRVMVLFGASGSGKTTILRCLAGLDRPQEGFIRFGEEIWFDAAAGTNLSPQQRRLAYVSQDYGLFPDLTVEQNIRVGVDAPGSRA